jgi:squalene cyclase
MNFVVVSSGLGSAGATRTISSRGGYLISTQFQHMMMNLKKLKIWWLMNLEKLKI